MFSKEPLKIRSICLRKDKKLMAVLGKTLYHDIKIYKTTTNKYYLCFPTDVKKEYPVLNNKKIGIYDPGGKTFQTEYRFIDLICEMREIGVEIDKQIIEILKEIDKIKAKRQSLRVNKDIYTDKEIKKYSKIYGREYKRLHEKLRNMINDMHMKAITKLLQNDVIYIPKLNTQNIVEQADFNKMSKRVLNTLRHGAFIKRLKESAEIAGKIVIECSEYLTTQICDVCFEKNACESRTYECEHCHNVVDRDQHSAKLIFMRQITNIKQDESFAIQIELK